MKEYVMSEGTGWGSDGNYALPRPSGKGKAKKQLSLVPVAKKGVMPPEGESVDSGSRASSGGDTGSSRNREQGLPRGQRTRETEDTRERGGAGAPLPLPVKGGKPSGLPLPKSGKREGDAGLPLPGTPPLVREKKALPLPGAPVGDEGASAGGRSGRPRGGVNAPGAVDSLVVADEGWDEDNPALSEADPTLDKKRAAEFVSASRGVRITDRDIAILQFLARFRYAQSIQVARYVGSSQKAVDQRLTKLGKAGLLRREDVTRGQGLWTPTGWGLSTADLDFSAIGEGKISYVTIAHTLGLVNVGIELETGQENMLGEEVWPQENRVSLVTGELLPGETLVTEREIRQGQSRWKKSGMARRDSEQAFSLALSAWLAGDRDGPTPELEVGNEAMLILWATKVGRSDHIPDLVVARPRGDDGRAGSHAIELELNSKPLKEWSRILESFYEAKDLYAHVHYFTHKKSIADSVTRVAEDVGLVQEGRFSMHRYVPRAGRLPFWG